MQILFATSECTPFASTGGLADVAAALPKALAGQGVDVATVMPMYRQVFSGGFNLKKAGLPLSIPVGFRKLSGEVWYSDDSGLRTYFVRRDEFYDRSSLYSMPDREYDDNLERFIFFQKAIIEIINNLGLKPDIVHCNDWHTGLLPLYLEHGISGTGRSGPEKTVLTIHNLFYQGTYPGSDFSITGLPYSCFSTGCMEFFGNINLLKAGLTSANAITTVSETYAKEIQTPERGEGLQGVLGDRADVLTGIVNGVDYGVWDPGKDPHIAAVYSAEDLSGKAKCRASLLKKMGLKARKNQPVIGMVARMTDQKGFDILAEAIPRLMEETDVVLVMLGSGDEHHQVAAQEWVEKWPKRFALKLGFDVPLSHQIEAGSDMFLMPSRFEPCGLNQLYSLRYGTIPVVHATGGLEDTIADMSEAGKIGTGFKFREYTADALVEAVLRGLVLFTEPDSWMGAMKRGMAQDFSYDACSRKYLSVYESVLG
ncbi:MAG: glycogen synthase GlgA [Verrucomicrobia bacterium]|nr:glycogen synthase GlgA [Verrucomicrobiota bacterium]